jgi:hypothetical protein
MFLIRPTKTLLNKEVKKMWTDILEHHGVKGQKCSHYYLCGTIGIIQALLFFSSWVVGMNSSTTKRQAVAIILFVLGVGLTAPFCLLMV